MKERLELIISSISAEISDVAVAVGGEQRHPMYSGDAMDDYISEGKKKIAKLRALREEIENVWAGLL